MSVCTITFMGNLGRDPEVKYSEKGSITTLNVGVGQGRKQPDGTWSNETDWFRVTIFGDRGVKLSEQLRKGSKVVVSGRFSTRTYEKDGQKRVSLEVIANEVVQVGAKPAGDGEAASLAELSW